MQMRIVAFVLLVFGVSTMASGEELLTKNGGDYLGSRKRGSNTAFVVCNGGVIEIGNGKVKATPRKCMTNVGQLAGVVTEVENNAIEIKDDFGTKVKFTLKDSEKASLTLVVGDKLAISGRSADTRHIQ